MLDDIEKTKETASNLTHIFHVKSPFLFDSKL